MKHSRSPFTLFLTTLALAGCGGGGSHSSGTTPVAIADGQAIVSVVWPDRPDARLVPNAANSVTIVIAQGSTVLTQTLSRPAAGGTSAASFIDLKYGAYTVAVKAFPNADGSGVAQAIGAGGLTVAEDAPGVASVALASTVTSLTLTPSPLTFDKGKRATVTVSATDASGAIVLLSAGDGTEPLSWSVDATTNATLTTSGLTATLTGVHSGTGTLSVSMLVDDAGSKVTGVAPVTVNAINDGTGTVTVH